MVSKKEYIFCIMALVLVGAGIYAKKDRQRRKCSTTLDCHTNKHCQCYCSEIGGFRNKTEDDVPVYIQNDQNKDKNGNPIGCYCKQWDLDKFPGPVTRNQ